MSDVKEIEFDDLVEDVNTSELEDGFDYQPIENSNYMFGNFQLVGHGERACGTFSGFCVCALNFNPTNVVMEKDIALVG